MSLRVVASTAELLHRGAERFRKTCCTSVDMRRCVTSRRLLLVRAQQPEPQADRRRGRDIMDDYRRFEAACQAVGLELGCEASRTEPRFRASLDRAETGPILYLRYRNDDTITPAVLHHDPAVPGVLFEIVEETVRREPTLELWLPCTTRHRFVAWRQAEDWTLAPLPESATAATVTEAVALLATREDDMVPG